MWGLKGRERKIKTYSSQLFSLCVLIFDQKHNQKSKFSYFIRFSILAANQFWVCVT